MVELFESDFNDTHGGEVRINGDDLGTVAEVYQQLHPIAYESELNKWILKNDYQVVYCTNNGAGWSNGEDYE